MLDVKIEKEIVRLSGEATVYFAKELKQGLLDALRACAGPMVIDMQGLDALDLAGGQLLAAFRSTYGTARVRFQSCPDEVRRVLELSGLTRVLFDRAHAEGH